MGGGLRGLSYYFPCFSIFHVQKGVQVIIGIKLNIRETCVLCNNVKTHYLYRKCLVIIYLNTWSCGSCYSFISFSSRSWQIDWIRLEECGLNWYASVSAVLHCILNQPTIVLFADNNNQHFTHSDMKRIQAGTWM